MRFRSAVLALAGLAVVASPVAADAPRNASRDSAVRVAHLPASILGTLKGVNRGAGPASPCAATAGALWYRFDAGASRRIVARLVAAGQSDATVDVFARRRSEQRLLTCDTTAADGRAAVAFDVVRGRQYLLRVSRRVGSTSDAFRLTLKAVPSATRFPGPVLPRTGVSGTLDRVERTREAWSTTLRAGTRYRIAVTHPGDACITAQVFGPHPRRGARPVADISCRGYRLFTPHVGRGGRYSVVVRAEAGRHGNQRYHLEVASAEADDSAPGLAVPNLTRVTDSLDGRGVDHVDLYHFDVTRRSVVFLHLRTRGAFDLVLLDAWGDVIRCRCDDRGNQAFHKGLRPGRFFVAVRTRNSTARYALLRISRVITKSTVRVDGAGAVALAPGQPATVSVLTRPAVDGPATVVFEQFDPLAGWQFVRALHTVTRGGIATVSWTPPTTGRWRATATFDGTRSSASSATGFVRMLVAAPLTD
jgi:hypothetical protein